MKRGRCGRWSGSLALSLALAASAAAQPLTLEMLGDGPRPVPGVGQAELSGITWLGGEHYLAVDDGSPRLLPLDVRIDASSGRIAEIAVGAWLPVGGKHDLEGIAWRASEQSVLVTDELGHQILELDARDAKLRRRGPPPLPFRGRLRTNQGIEGIAVSADAGEVWIANETPLRRDGDAASALRGALVRLLRMDAGWVPTGQWAYRTESGLGFVGVVDLALLPGGGLLVLERALTGAGFSSHIFAVDFAGATEISGIESLPGHDELRPVGKRLLWQRAGGFQNFEGIALGPELASGGRLVLLVSDGGGRAQPTLLALRLAGAASAAEEPESR
jgi:Esterase-like activity of phytase